MATVRLTLEIEPDEVPISGRVTGPDDQQREFYGWTALATTIDTALHTDKPPPGARSSEANDTTDEASPAKDARPRRGG